MNFTKADLINKVYNSQTTLTKKEARIAVETILRTIKSSLESNEDVLLSGFGKFNVKSKSVRKGRNPQTGESLMIAARKIITFKPSRILRDKVNGSNESLTNSY